MLWATRRMSSAVVDVCRGRSGCVAARRSWLRTRAPEEWAIPTRVWTNTLLKAEEESGGRTPSPRCQRCRICGHNSGRSHRGGNLHGAETCTEHMKSFSGQHCLFAWRCCWRVLPILLYIYIYILCCSWRIAQHKKIIKWVGQLFTKTWAANSFTTLSLNT